MATKNDEYCQCAVPDKSKKSTLSIAFILANFICLTFFSPSLWTGGSLSIRLTLDVFLFALFIGNLSLGIYSALLGYIGSKTGFSTHLLARFAFGVKGSWLPSLVLSITQVGWFGAGLIMFAYPISKLISIDMYVLVIIFGLIITLTVTLEGIKGLFYLSLIALPGLILVGSYSIWLTIEQTGGLLKFISMKGKEPLAKNAPIIMIVGSFISVAILTADFVRFGSHAKSVFFFTIFCFLFGNLILFFFTPVGNIYLLIGIFGIMILLTIMLEGIKGLFYLSAFAAPFITIVSCYSLWIAMTNATSFYIAKDSTEPLLDFPSALTFIIGSFISGGTLTADFSRFSRHPIRVFFIIIFAFLLGKSFMFIFGAAGVWSMGFCDISDLMIAQGMSILAILVLGLNIWTTNDNALYTSGLGMANITRFPSQWLTLVNGFLGILSALWIYHHFVSWLTFLSMAISPVGGIIIADYFIHKDKYLDLKNSEEQQLNSIAFAAVTAGILGPHYLPGIVPINAVLCSVSSYFILTLLKKKYLRSNLPEKHPSNSRPFGMQ